ncbi:unnamed protein product [Orchesella dallaii]|uniref:Uncharacterized protein n=1 Tax=Orchesella dallaii TaxID=48710 RepID=A0ABP1RZN5_9HEXA
MGYINQLLCLLALLILFELIISFVPGAELWVVLFYHYATFGFVYYLPTLFNEIFQGGNDAVIISRDNWTFEQEAVIIRQDDEALMEENRVLLQEFANLQLPQG